MSEQKSVLKIEGMSCNGCRGKVEKRLAAIPGVTHVTVELEARQATIIGSAKTDVLVEAIEDLGFTVID
ncbi:heavy-metal-associated domain-containing protein|uniref:Copper chaperone n=1 Tax=Dendrosporobacter quercicolus TaxID=146817 RepID=A0A1G9TRI7_9FIRM|nr:heavy metal-associated domain-containing protein [Dendrosporobacter quercicolus]NSL48880.1 heavy-metal-associated domain-containing protein [Dendrosporobacter quercicolus DSM 1736]SDM50188.1 copper chaperone [Dendrosporobacter quercicolus]